LTSSEKNLVERFRGGEQEAFDELYRLMHGQVYRFALRLTGHTEDAEDVAVQTFIEAYRSRQGWRGTSRIETWLYRIAVHTAARARRTRRHHPMPEQELADPGASEHVGSIELQQMLMDLPEDLRAAFLLVKIEGLTHKEASEVLGRRQGTVQSHVFQASRLLRAQFLLEAPTVKCDDPKRSNL
jgi:RNA polymerase sigma-70 factor, ECF subfamily